MPYGQFVSNLNDKQVYEIEFDSKRYQIEIEILESTEEYIHVMMAIDDGTLPASILPLTYSFIRKKPGSAI